MRIRSELTWSLGPAIFGPVLIFVVAISGVPLAVVAFAALGIVGLLGMGWRAARQEISIVGDTIEVRTSPWDVNGGRSPAAFRLPEVAVHRSAAQQWGPFEVVHWVLTQEGTPVSARIHTQWLDPADRDALSDLFLRHAAHDDARSAHRAER